MAAPKGHKKYGGRQKGTPNKLTMGLLEKCHARGIDLFDALLDIIQETEDPLLKFNAIKEACQYVYPKRKAIEHSGANGEDVGIKIVIEDYGSKK